MLLEDLKWNLWGRNKQKEKSDKREIQLVYFSPESALNVQKHATFKLYKEKLVALAVDV